MSSILLLLVFLSVVFLLECNLEQLSVIGMYLKTEYTKLHMILRMNIAFERMFQYITVVVSTTLKLVLTT